MCSKCKKVPGFFRQLVRNLWHRLNTLPVSARVTLWYTLFLTLILVLFTGVLLNMGEDYERRTSGRTLIKAVEKASDRYEKKEGKFKAFDNNDYLSLRDHTGRLLKGGRT